MELTCDYTEHCAVVVVLFSTSSFQLVRSCCFLFIVFVVVVVAVAVVVIVAVGLLFNTRFFFSFSLFSLVLAAFVIHIAFTHGTALPVRSLCVTYIGDMQITTFLRVFENVVEKLSVYCASSCLIV